MMNCVVHCLATIANSALLCCTLCFNLSPPTIVLFMASGNQFIIILCSDKCSWLVASFPGRSQLNLAAVEKTPQLQDKIWK